MRKNVKSGFVFFFFTCCSTGAAYIEVVPKITSQAFLRCFRRFVTVRSRPSLVVPDNAKTFKSASKELEKIKNYPSDVEYFVQEKIKWSYNLEKAPCGDVFTTTGQVTEDMS